MSTISEEPRKGLAAFLTKLRTHLRRMPKYGPKNVRSTHSARIATKCHPKNKFALRSYSNLIFFKKLGEEPIVSVRKAYGVT